MALPSFLTNAVTKVSDFIDRDKIKPGTQVFKSSDFEPIKKTYSTVKSGVNTLVRNAQKNPAWTKEEIKQGVRDLPRSAVEMGRQLPEATRRTLTAFSPVETAVAGLIKKSPDDLTPSQKISRAFMEDTDLVDAFRSRNIPGAFPLGLVAGLVLPGAGEIASLRKAKEAGKAGELAQELLSGADATAGAVSNLRPVKSTSMTGTRMPDSVVADTLPFSDRTTTRSPSNKYTPDTSVEAILKNPEFVNKYETAVGEKPYLDSIISQLAGDRSYKTGIKEAKTAAGKIVRKLPTKPGYTENDLGDLIRGNIVAKNDTDALTLVEQLKGRTQVTGIEDYITNPTEWGYQGINVNIRTPKGNMAEIQIHTPASIEIQDALHPIYEKWRSYLGDVPEEVIANSQQIAKNIKLKYATPAQPAQAITPPTQVIPEKPLSANALPTGPPKPPAKPPGMAGVEPPKEVPLDGKLEVGGGKYNIEDFDFSEDVNKLFRENAIKQEDIIAAERRGKISFEQTRKAANDLLGKDYEWLKKRRPGRVLNDAEITRAMDLVKTQFDTKLKPLQDAYNEALKTSSTTAKQKAELLEALNEASALQAKALGARTEAGRSLNALKMLKEALKDPNQAKVEKIIKEFGGDDKVDDILKKFNQLTVDDPSGRQAFEFIRSMNKANFGEKVHWYWVNAILSGPRTQERNLISNSLMVALRPIDKTFAAIADLPRVATGKLLGKGSTRERFFGEVGAEFTGIGRGLVEGLKKGIHVVRHGYSPEDVAKLEIQNTEPVRGILGATVGLPLRLLSGTDQVFKSIIFNMEMSAQAYRAAAKEGAGLGKMSDRMAEILRDPTEEMINSASSAALKGTFQDLFGNGSFAEKVNRLRNWDAGKGIKPLKFILPFLQTPINVAKVGLQRGPITGLPANLVEAAMKQGGERSDALGRAMFAATTGSTIAWLTWNGMVTGEGPANKKDQDLLRKTGWQPYSLRITDPRTGQAQWISYKGYAPLDQMFNQIASLHEQFVYNQEAPNEEKMSNFFFDLLKNTTNQTFMTGVADWLEALTDPESKKAQTFFSRLGASFIVPNLIRTVAQMQDRVLRKPEGFIEQVKSGLPGLSKTVTPKTDQYDVPIVYEGSALSPSSISRERLPVEAARKQMALKEQIRRAVKELENGKKPTAIDDNRKSFLTAEFIYSKLKKTKDLDEESAVVEELQKRDLFTRETAQMVEDLQTMDEAGLTKKDREMMLYPPGLVRAQMIIERYNDFGKIENAEKMLSTLEEAGLLDEETGQYMKEINSINQERRLKAGSMTDITPESGFNIPFISQ